MITKQLNNYIGYGSTEEEAETSCKVISILKGIHNITNFEGLDNRRLELSPWAPRQNSLHIRNIGYITVKEGSICYGNTRVQVSCLFEMLYKCFYNYLNIVDLMICSEEIRIFLISNDISIPSFSSYSQVVPEDIYMYSENILCNVITEKYSIVFFSNNKVAIKRNFEELYWTCQFDPNISSYIDTMYYIAYVRGYEEFEYVVRGETSFG